MKVSWKSRAFSILLKTLFPVTRYHAESTAAMIARHYATGIRQAILIACLLGLCIGGYLLIA